MSEKTKKKANKQFNSRFYQIDYYKYVTVKKLRDNELIQCRIMNQVSYALIKELEEKFGFHVSASEMENIEAITGNGCNRTLVHVNGIISKGQLDAAKQCAHEYHCVIRHDRMFMQHINNPEGYLFAGWNTGFRTKIKPEDLPESYVYISNYKKHGYLETAGVVDVLYMPSTFNDHTFKDDFLYISYGEPLYYDGNKPFDIFVSADEYISGNDIVDVVKGIEKNNQVNADILNKIAEIKHNMVRKYNACDENHRWERFSKKELFG